MQLRISMDRLFQSSLGVKTRCNCECKRKSIHDIDVSILIQLKDRMQQLTTLALYPMKKFQSSSSLKTGCNKMHGSYQVVQILFQSSSSLKTGCNNALGSVENSVIQWFQSSSSLKTGCNQNGLASYTHNSFVFQSSSSLKTGCNYPSQMLCTSHEGFNPHRLKKTDATLRTVDLPWMCLYVSFCADLS